jgi:hypothetical protein
LAARSGYAIEATLLGPEISPAKRIGQRLTANKHEKTENEPQINADVRGFEWSADHVFRVGYYGEVRDIFRRSVPFVKDTVEAETEICVNLRPSAVRFPSIEPRFGGLGRCACRAVAQHVKLGSPFGFRRWGMK